MVGERAARVCPALACGIAAALGLSACSDLSASGPSSPDVVAARAAVLPYRVVPITPAVLASVRAAEPGRLAGRFPPSRRPARIVLGIGDVVSIAVYEASVGGLFVPGDSGSRPSNSVTLPNQTIDVAGNVSFPFGGAVRAAGRTTVELQHAILARIKDRAIDPQVIVTVVSQETSLVSVEGAVRTPLRFPAAASGAQDRITDAITRAGGLSEPGWDSWVSLERGGQRATAPFEALLLAPAEDIFVEPGDRILVYREPQRFVALGAFGPRAATPPKDTRVAALGDIGRADIPFGNWRLSLAEAVAKAGGLIDTRADPASLFLYRREPAAVARQLGPDPGNADPVPVVFRLDLRDPAGFLLATRFPMRNGDILYAANAPAADATKFIGYVDTYLSTAVNASTAALVGNAAARGFGQTGLPTIGGLTVVPSGVSGQPGTITPTGLADGVAVTTTPTGGTADGGGTARTGTAGATATTTAADKAAASLLAPRATMASPASR